MNGNHFGFSREGVKSQNGLIALLAIAGPLLGWGMCELSHFVAQKLHTARTAAEEKVELEQCAEEAPDLSVQASESVDFA